jgi:periplasmic protein TonB
MNFSQRQADPRRHLVGITFVILFHAFIVYALVTGLAKKVVDVVRAPIETKVIEEIKKPPPPPEIVLPPPPKLEAPPPPYIPPP